MTEEEMTTEAERVLVRYSRNEKVILCLMSRLADVREGIEEVARIAPTAPAEAECDRLLEALTGRETMKDVHDLKAALARRENLKVDMVAHGYGHMLR